MIRHAAPVRSSAAPAPRAAARRDLPGPVRDVLAQPGQALPEHLRRTLEPALGADFSRVRVHADADHAARSVGAGAFACGQHVAFARGRYAPHTPAGLALLAHELGHVAEGEPGLARDGEPTRREAAGKGLDIDVSRALAFSPRVRPHVPRAPNVAWSTRVAVAQGSAAPERARAFMELINEALQPDAALYPDLRLPVKRFTSDAAARHGDLLFDAGADVLPGGRGVRADTRPNDDRLTTPPRVFIVFTAGALHPDDGPVFTQRVLAHEYVHFGQKVRRELMQRPACRGAIRNATLGGNPDREVLAIAATITRFFGPWADSAEPEKPFPKYLWEDFALLQGYFRCVDEAIRARVVTSIAALATTPERRDHLLRLLEQTRDFQEPSLARPAEDDAVARIARAVGRPLRRDARLPPAPARPRFGPLFDMGEFMRRGHQRRVAEEPREP
jgi:hypothetical protein